jgi:hypothetical protein
MKDDLHNDRLEEFLRKSLEGHSEDPPADLWSKIAGNLELPVADLPSAAPTQLTPRLRVLRQWWSVAAAAAVMTGLLIGQHFYFSGKIEHLNKALEQNATQLKELEQKRLVEQQQQTTLQMEEAIESQAAAQNLTTAESEVPSNVLQGKTQHDQPAKQKRVIRSSANQNPKQKKQVNNTEGNAPPTSIANAQNEEKNAGNPVENTAQANETKQMEEKPAAAPMEAAVVAKQPDMPRTWGRKLMPLQMPELPAPTAKSIIPAIAQQDSRYFIGLQMMPMITNQKVDNIKAKEPGPQPPFPPKRDNSFTAENEKSIKSWMTGVALETKLTPKLRLGTGLNYRVLDIETTHEICLKYSDGKPVHGNHDEREYEYELNTATGSVQMLVSAAATGSPSSLSDTTKVEAKIKTSEHLTFASLPLYANYSIGNGRLRVLAKAGLIFNFLLDSDFSLDRIERPQDSKFQFDRRGSRHGSANDLQTLTASYMASLGLEYQLSKSLSLRAEPTVMGSLTSLHNNPFIESSEFSAGLNVGVMYSF